jgi:hypothetical protein
MTDISVTQKLGTGSNKKIIKEEYLLTMANSFTLFATTAAQRYKCVVALSGIKKKRSDT